MASDVAAAVQAAENFMNSVNSKIESSQPSPASTNSSKDSGVQEENNNAQQPRPIAEQRSSRASVGSVSPVLEQLEQMIVSDEWVDREGSTSSGHTPVSRVRSRDGQKLSELGRTLVTSASLKAYIDLLGNHHRQSIAAWLYGNTCGAFAQQFRYPESAVYCSPQEGNIHQSIRHGIGHAVRLALHEAYGGAYAANGWKAFAEQGAPVIYLSPALHLEVASYLTFEFGIPDIVQLEKLSAEMCDIEGRIDHHAFEKLLDRHAAEGKRPLMLVGVVGSTILGQNDMISKILEIRRNKGKFWLHVVGQAAAALALKDPSEVLVHVLSQVDSITMPLATWLGIPAAPVITLHRQPEGLKPTYREKLDTLPWWVATQYLTSRKITEILENAYMLSKLMLKGLASISQVEVVGMDNPAAFAAQVYKNQFTAPTVLIFRYKYPPARLARQALEAFRAKEGEKDENEEQILRRKAEEELEYSDSLNSWLGQGLLTECQHLGMYMIELGGLHGTAFRFCPLEHSAALGSNVDHVQKYIKQLNEILKIVESTVQARSKFDEIKDEFPSLALLPIRKWAGVGAVCYIPSIVKETTPLEWNEKQRQQVSHLNLELVHQLRAVDSAFSSGESAAYQVSCVKFGMLSDAKDLEDLVRMVAEKGKEIENSQQYLDSLADLIRQGIEAANEDLKKENENRLQQEGVMRQLPIMGSLVNWFSPLDKEAHAIKGRSFDLKTGQILSTDTVFQLTRKSSSGSVDAPLAPHTLVRPTEALVEEKEEENGPNVPSNLPQDNVPPSTPTQSPETPKTPLSPKVK